MDCRPLDSGHLRLTAWQNEVVTKADLHQLVDRLPDGAVDGAAILLREVTDGDADLAAGRATRFESDEDFLAELDERMKPLDADA